MKAVFVFRLLLVINVFLSLMGRAAYSEESPYGWIRSAFVDKDSRSREAAAQWLEENKKTLIETHELPAILNIMPAGDQLPKELESVTVDYLSFLELNYRGGDRDLRLRRVLGTLETRPGVLLFGSFLKGLARIPEFDPANLVGWERLTNTDHGLYGEYVVCLAKNAKGPNLRRYISELKSGSVLAQRNLIWAAGLVTNRELWKQIAELSDTAESANAVDDYCESLGQIAEQLAVLEERSPSAEGAELLKFVAKRLERLVPLAKDEVAKNIGERGLARANQKNSGSRTR